MTKYGRDKDGQYFISSYRVTKNGVLLEGPFRLEGSDNKGNIKKVIKNE